MTPDAFCELHLRLVNDPAIAFRSLGENRIRTLPAGKAWLRDHAAYLTGWIVLEQHGYHVPTLLKHRFGYVTNDELPDEAPKPEPAAPDLTWYEDRPRGPE